MFISLSEILIDSHINIMGLVLAASSLEGDDKIILSDVAVAFSSGRLLDRSEICRESCCFTKQAFFPLPPSSHSLLPPPTDVTEVHRTHRNVATRGVFLWVLVFFLIKI